MLDIGSTDQNQLRLAAISAYGERPDASGTPQEILSERVISVARRRLQIPEKAAEEVSGASFAVFLISDDLRNDRQRLNAVHTPALDNASQRLSGAAWIVPQTFASAARLPINNPDLGCVFQEIENLGLGERLAVVVDFSVPDVRIYPNGIIEDTNVVRVPIASDDLASLSLDALLDDFANNFILTPGAGNPSVSPWQDGDSYVPIKHAEKKIQDYLHIYLRSRLADTHVIEAEYPTKLGRIDLVVNRKSAASDLSRVATIEMKVARSFSSRATPTSKLRPTSQGALVRHTAKGFRQAQAYRDEIGAKSGYLIIYDLRKIEDRTNDLLAVHRGDADIAKITLRCDDVFGSAEDCRARIYG